MSIATLRLVSSAAQVRDNHATYQREMASSGSPARQALVEVIPYIQSWVAVYDNRQFLFAPSKFVGYRDMTAEMYRRHHKDMDGRVTERVIAPWIRVMGEGGADYDHARDQLFDFCATFGKKPNGRCRLSLLPAGHDESRRGDRDSVVAELLVEVFDLLPPVQQQHVTRRITHR
jgi:hypothetical protein